MANNWRFAVVALLLLITLTLPAGAVSWSTAKTAGITQVESTLDSVTNTYTWALTNLSGTPESPVSDHVIAWWIQPFNVPEPVSYTAPGGWTWSGIGKTWENFGIAQENKKYYTPYSLAPGQSLTFTFTFDPGSDLVNIDPDAGEPGVPAFLCHVGAVVPGSGTLDGSERWIASSKAHFGSTWYDRPATFTRPTPVVPEPGGLITMAFGLTAFGGLLTRLRRRA